MTHSLEDQVTAPPTTLDAEGVITPSWVFTPRAGHVFPHRHLRDLPLFPTPGLRVIAVAVQKGGSGKTATAIGLADCLAQMGIPVVVVDVCHSGMATKHLGLKISDKHENLANLMLGKWDGTIEDLAIQRDENLYIVPCSYDMIPLNKELLAQPYREERLRAAIYEIAQRAVVIIDCPPALDEITNNAILACGDDPRQALRQRGGILLCPELVGASLETQEQLLTQVRVLERVTPYSVPILGWFASMTDTTTDSEEARMELAKTDLIKLGEMPRRTRIKTARTKGLTFRELGSKKDSDQIVLPTWQKLGDTIREKLDV